MSVQIQLASERARRECRFGRANTRNRRIWHCATEQSKTKSKEENVNLGGEERMQTYAVSVKREGLQILRRASKQISVRSKRARRERRVRLRAKWSASLRPPTRASQSRSGSQLRKVVMVMITGREGELNWQAGR